MGGTGAGAQRGESEWATRDSGADAELEFGRASRMRRRLISRSRQHRVGKSALWPRRGVRLVHGTSRMDIRMEACGPDGRGEGADEGPGDLGMMRSERSLTRECQADQSPSWPAWARAVKAARARSWTVVSGPVQAAAIASAPRASWLAMNGSSAAGNSPVFVAAGRCLGVGQVPAAPQIDHGCVAVSILEDELHVPGGVRIRAPGRKPQSASTR
jgi:hypothetical protein